MAAFTERGRAILADLSARYGVREDAVATLAHAVAAGGGTQAQFSHPDLGGMGQWSRGGMTMVGDMFNNSLKAKVDGLCNELSTHLAAGDLFDRAPRPAAQGQSQSQGSGAAGMASFSFPAADWQEELGRPSATGSQNDLRYAVFPATRRLAIAHPGGMTVYDTGDHAIGGVSQQQSGDRTLTFTSQHGLVRAADLPVVSGAGNPGQQSRQAQGTPQAASQQPGDEEAGPALSFRRAATDKPASGATDAPASRPAAAASRTPVGPQDPPAATSAAPPAPDLLATLERLAELRDRGILTDDEFAAKKADILSRL